MPRIARKMTRIRKNWLATYLALVMLPLIACFLLMLNADRSLKEKCASANDMYLTQALDTIDYELAKVAEQCSTVIMDASFQRLYTISDETSNDYAFNTYLIKRQFNTYFTNIVTNVFAFREDGGVFSRYGYLPSSYAKNALKRLTGMDANWRESVDVGERGFTTIWYEGSFKLAYYLNCSVFKSLNIRGEVLAILNRDRIEALLNDLLRDGDERLSLEDGAGTELVSSGSCESAGALEFKMISPSSGYALIWRVSEYAYFAELQSFNIYAHVALFLCVLIEATLIVWLFRRNYRPIQKLVQKVTVDLKDDELGAIEKMIVEMTRENSSLKDTVARQDMNLSDSLLRSLLKGDVLDADRLNAYAQRYDIRFEDDAFVIALLRATEGAAELTKCLDAAPEYRLSSVRIDGMLAMIFTFHKQTLEALAVRELAERLHAELPGASVALSAPNSGVEAISRCYREAMYALSCAEAQGGGAVTRYDELAAEFQDGAYYYTLDQEQQLTNLLRIGARSRILAFTNEMFEQNTSGDARSLSALRCLTADILLTFVKFANAADFPSIGLDWLSSLSRCATIVQMKQLLASAIDDVVVSRSIPLGDGYSKTVSDIIAYVDEHFMSQDLNVNTVSFAFERNPSYISNLFREQTNVKLLDYINKRRLHCAKQLLLNRELSLREIAERSGLSDAATLARIFRRYEGVTPTEYRNHCM